MKDRPRRGWGSRPSTGHHRTCRSHRPINPGQGGHRGHRRRARGGGRRHRSRGVRVLIHPHPDRQSHRRVWIRRHMRGCCRQLQLTDRDLRHHRRRRWRRRWRCCRWWCPRSRWCGRGSGSARGRARRSITQPTQQRPGAVQEPRRVGKVGGSAPENTRTRRPGVVAAQRPAIPIQRRPRRRGRHT